MQKTLKVLWKNYPIRMRRLLQTSTDKIPPGVFLGYELAPGGRWSGRYLVADINDFTGKCLAQETYYSEFDIRSPSTAIVKLGKKGIHFPCKARCEYYNHTLEGREEFWDCAPDPVKRDALTEDEETSPKQYTTRKSSKCRRRWTKGRK